MVLVFNGIVSYPDCPKFSEAARDIHTWKQAVTTPREMVLRKKKMPGDKISSSRQQRLKGSEVQPSNQTGGRITVRTVERCDSTVESPV
ncbi:hypothetical protein chiPu_0015084 [Chiloscyllium punctatum]|uniref:Uncharacterized protein n=1 Tax=Chiloscyllium punctatum TaxID=137246 RepID=A0A401T1R3_CHIPU|nr:hypothetical protein [Chiloscyllium punctatum]